MTAPTKPPTAGEIARARRVVSEIRWIAIPTAIERAAETLLAALDAAEREPGPTLAKYQPCGCVVCTCDSDTRCGGCGARLCDRHRAEPSSLWRDPGAAFEAHSLVERATKAERERDTLAREACRAFGADPVPTVERALDFIRSMWVAASSDSARRRAERAEARVAELERRLRESEETATAQEVARLDREVERLLVCVANGDATITRLTRELDEAVQGISDLSRRSTDDIEFLRTRAEKDEARVVELEAGLRALADEYGPSDCRKRCLRLLVPSGSNGGGA